MNRLEDILQIESFRWFRLQYPDVVIFAIPNGGSRNQIEAAKLKRTGTLPGVADLFVMRNALIDVNYEYYLKHGLFIELKVGKNKQTPAQIEFQQKAERAGYSYRVCRSFDEFQTTVENYLQ